MSDPYLFDTASPRFGLPLLFAGQSQKEVFVNEAFALADALLHCSIEGTAAQPPASPSEGQNWLVSDSPTGDWTGRAGQLACFQGGSWLYVSPRDGLRVLDRLTEQELLYHGGWQRPAAPAMPSGGAVIDNEARTAIADIVAALRLARLLPAT